jgi:hypothetical protein
MAMYGMTHLPLELPIIGTDHVRCPECNAIYDPRATMTKKPHIPRHLSADDAADWHEAMKHILGSIEDETEEETDASSALDEITGSYGSLHEADPRGAPFDELDRLLAKLNEYEYPEEDDIADAYNHWLLDFEGYRNSGGLKKRRADSKIRKARLKKRADERLRQLREQREDRDRNQARRAAALRDRAADSLDKIKARRLAQSEMMIRSWKAENHNRLVFEPDVEAVAQERAQQAKAEKERPSWLHVHRFHELFTAEKWSGRLNEMVEVSAQRCRCGAEREAVRRLGLIKRTIRIRRMQRGTYGE